MKKKPVADGQLHPANIGDLFDEGLDYNQRTLATPRPWKLDADGWTIYPASEDPMSQIALVVDEMDHSNVETVANAELIVRAVNAHDNHEATLAEARRVSADNANIAMKAIGMLAECQQKLVDVTWAAEVFLSVNHDGRLGREKRQELLNETVAAKALWEKQKETKLV